MAENSYKKALDEAIKDIDILKSKIKELNEPIKEASRLVREGLGGFKSNSATDLNNKIKETTTSLNGLKESVKSQEREERRLAKAREKLTIAYQQGKIEERAAIKNAKLQAQALSPLVGAYQNLIAQRELAKKKLQDEISKEKQNIAVIKQAQKEYDVLAGRVNRANAATSNFAAGGLGKAIIGLKNLAAAFGLIGGVFLVAQIVRNIFELSKKLDSLGYAMRTVIKEAKDFAQTQAFLARIANSYGASIVALTERYIKFVAAAKQSNMALKDTEKIFEGVTKAAGVLGLKKDELNGVFLALEQMISKGKVTTEELRRQLGERLPGAFGIMANALGVTVAQLDQMLRKGEILSSEALPKFTDAMIKAYGIENVTRVDTLVAAQERLNNEWIEFVAILGGEKGGSAVIGTLDALASMMGFISLRVERFFEIFNTGYTPLERGQIAINKLTKLWGIYDGVMSESTEKIIAANREHALLVKTVRQEGIEARVAAEQFRILHGSMAPFADGGEYSKGDFFNFMDSYNEGERTAEDVANDIKRLNKQLQETPKQDTSKISFLKESILLLQEEAKIWEIGNDKKKDAKLIMEGSVAALNEMKSGLEDQQGRLATTTEAWKDYEKQIEAVELRIAYLKSGMASLDEVSSLVSGSQMGEKESIKDKKGEGNAAFQKMIDDEKMASAIIKTIKEDDYTFLAHLEVEQLKNLESKHEKELKEAKDLSEEKLKILKEGQQAETEALEKQQEHNREIIAEAIALEKELRSDFADAVIDLGASVLDARAEKVQEEIDVNREKYAVMLDDENLSEEQRSALEAERDRKEIELEAKKKKRENEAFLFRQAIALAEVGINLARTISAINLAATAMDIMMPWLLGGAGVAYKAANIPFAIGTAAASAGSIIAQSIPAFEKGTDNAPEGVAMVDEKRPEVHTDKAGNVKSWGSSGGANLRYLEAGDKIYKSHDDFFRSHNDEDINRAVFNMNMSSQGAEISKHQTDNALRNEMRAMRASNDMVWKEVKKLANRPINNNVTVITEDKSAY